MAFQLIDRATGELVFDGQRVSSRLPCPVCSHLHSKQSWCLVDPIRQRAICPRVESRYRIGDAGWMHGLGEVTANSLAQVRQPEREVADFSTAWLSARQAIEAVDIERLAKRLCLPEAFVSTVPCGLHRNCWAFPMRIPCESEVPDWVVCGLKLRNETGKFCAKGSRIGLIVPHDFDRKGDTLVVTEGESDLMVAAGWGLNAVARAGCEQSVQQIALLARGRRLVIVSDKDEAGRRGAARLASVCKARAKWVTIMEPPCKDLREWHAQGATSADFNWRLRCLPRPA
jgi:hypothetical protein